MDRLTIPDVQIDEHTTRRTIIDGNAVREHAMEFYWRLKAIENIMGDEYDLDQLREMVQAEKDGRLAVLPFQQGKTLIDRSDPQRPAPLKNFRIAIAYDHCGIVFHQPFNIFLENVRAGYIAAVSEEAEAALEGGNG